VQAISQPGIRKAALRYLTTRRRHAPAGTSTCAPTA